MGFTLNPVNSCRESLPCSEAFIQALYTLAKARGPWLQMAEETGP